ncbi:hypothetical protein EFW57_03578 [Bacillus velezensis]|nr:hypothetical protein EFW57_03578 [Bacillus velezensis]
MISHRSPAVAFHNLRFRLGRLYASKPLNKQKNKQACCLFIFL